MGGEEVLFGKVPKTSDTPCNSVAFALVPEVQLPALNGFRL